MSGQKYELALPFSGLYGTSFYDTKKIKTDHGYLQESLNPYRFPWQWFVNINTKTCVRAFLIEGAGMRILGSPIGQGAAAYDIPAGLMLLHDLGRIWAMDRAGFESEYVAIDTLL